MRSLFPGYYKPTADEFAAIWRDATFVFDANVLLNLYRYPEKARNELLDVLSQVKDRIWIPHQVALEFQRNRSTVISEQKKRFQEVRDICDRTAKTFDSEISKLRLGERHSLIDPTKPQTEIRSVLDAFRKEIDALEERHIDVHQDDELRGRIENLIGDRIGPIPDQFTLDATYALGATRYEASVPPGYADAEKANNEDGVFMHAGLRYERQFGDLLVWLQILDYAKNSKPEALVLVTDDDKADWWRIVESQGKKTLGPRPELVEEMAREGGVSLFHMYKTSPFLKHAKTYLRAGVSDDAIDQVESVARFQGTPKLPSYASRQEAVLDWLQNSHPSSIIEESIIPDFTVKHSDGSKIYVEMMRPVAGLDNVAKALKELESLNDDLQSPLDGAEVVVACGSEGSASKQVAKFSRVNVRGRGTITIGIVHPDTDGRMRFVPLAHHRAAEARP